MKRVLKSVAPFAALLAVAACNGGGMSPSVPAAGNQNVTAAQSSGFSPVNGDQVVRACNGPRIGFAQCDVLIHTGTHPNVPAGWGPPDLQAAYNLPSSTGGTGQIVAVVDAFDDPNAVSDFNVYRSTYGLSASTLKKFNQKGEQKNYPTPDANWAVEESLDVDMMSAGCPNCTVYLVEANTNSFSDLAAAVDEAVKLGATVVSNSYGGTGGGSEQSHYNHKGTTILASAGDSGYGVQDPADFPSVVSVGGTVLTHATGKRKYSEFVWSGTGSGCSTYAKPSWQTDKGCTGRTMNDVSAVAVGTAIYDTYQFGGWGIVNGTSISSPLVGSVFGLAGNANKQDGGKTFWLTSHHKHLYDVTSGSNGSCTPPKSNAYLCTGEKGYDGPTGWGTPNGVGAF